MRKLFPLRYAIKEGMIVGKGISIVSPLSTCFGTEPYLITIGDYVRISGGVLFSNHDGGTWAFRHREEYKNVVKYGRISIGDYTFIGAHATIMPGVQIDCNCVIGVNSVVTKDVPDGTVVAGNPARFICTTNEYAEKCRRKMPDGINFQALKSDKKSELLRVYGNDQIAKNGK